MPSLLETAQNKLFEAADTVCLERARLVTEAWALHENDPAPLRRARCLAHILQHMTLDLTANPLMAGNTSTSPRAWMIVPEHGFGTPRQVEVEHDELVGFLDDKIPQPLRDFWKDRAAPATGGGPSGIGHLAIDLDLVVNVGLTAIIQRIEQSVAGDPVYRQAQVIALQAVIDWSHRYAKAAAALAVTTADEALALAHRRVAEACANVPANPARNLFEGLQAIALAHLATSIEGHGMSISVGLPDRALARFADEARDHAGQAVADTRAFLLKIAANSFLGRGSKTQALTVGGRNVDGTDACNAVTRTFLEAFERTAVSDPHLFLRWHAGLDPVVARRAAEMLAGGRSMPLLINDEPTIRGFETHGFAPADAAEYCVIGCNELGIPGRACSCAAGMGGVNYLDLLHKVMRDASVPAPENMEALWTRCQQAMTRHAHQAITSRLGERQSMAQESPTPLTSALMRDCEERGVDLLQDMPYHQPGFFERGLSNAANALAAIEEVVFTTRETSWQQLLDAMDKDWRDDAAASLRQRLEMTPHWGNDDDRADRWAQRLLDCRTQSLRDTAAATGLPPIMACHVVRSLHHLDGFRIGATPDGRAAKQAVGDSVGGVSGTMSQGPTAMLNSVLKIDAPRHYPGGYNLNITLPAGLADAGVIATLIHGFFADGGQELQVNTLDAARLRAARKEPEKHRDLVVRMAGLSARFVELSTLEQDELIARAEQCAMTP